MKVRSTLPWHEAQSRFNARCFDAICGRLDSLNVDHWPSLNALNCQANILNLANHRGQPIRFVAPNSDESVATHYEQRIAENGEIATRENWHDFFNAMQWLSFPKCKAAISEMHARLLETSVDGAKKIRSIPRDVLTLFDEGGVIVASDDETLLDHIRNFEWKKLFVERRADVERNVNFYLAGHSVLEKMLDPFIGVTAKGLLIKVDRKFSSLSHAEQVHEVDSRAAEWLMNAESLASTHNLHPLPILGIPGWHAANASASFYDDAHYFRAGRLRKPGIESANS